MVTYYFDNVIRNKSKHRVKPFHDAYRLLSDGCVHFVSLRETSNPLNYILYVFDDSLKYELETFCTLGDYRMVLKSLPAVYHYKEFLPF